MRMGASVPERNLEASDDGQNFRIVTELPGGSAPEQTNSFPAVTAKFFRVTFKLLPPARRCQREPPRIRATD